jgi:hypothetical protein
MNYASAIIVGAATAAIGTIIASKFINTAPVGGSQPKHIRAGSPTARSGAVRVSVPPRVSAQAAPIAQNTPITEAAYNTQPTSYTGAFGPATNQPAYEATLPM